MPARAVLVAALATACHAPPPAQPRWADAPEQLRDDSDRDAAIDRLWTMPAGAERDRVRAGIAAAIARRIADAIDDDRPFAAAELLDELTGLWQEDAPTVGRGLAVHAPLLRQLRAMFAKSGALEATIQTLVLLAEIEPAARADHLGELDEILAFADDLAVAENGPDARRAQPLVLLQPTANALPLPWLVERYVKMLADRQIAVALLLDTHGASLDLVRAHHDILTTARRIAIALARAGRPGDIHAQLARLKGIGVSSEGDRELLVRAEWVADQPTPEAYTELAGVLRTDEHTPDATAALAVARAGLARFPDDPGLLASAGGDARTLGRIDQAIALYERALRGSAEVDASMALRLGKLYGDRIGRLAGNGRPAAAKDAWRLVIVFTAGAARAHPHSVWQQTAAIAESALGKGLASQGLVEEGRHALTASLERAPSIDAYEMLTTIDVQIDRFHDAQKWAREGLALLGDTTSGDRYRRAKLERLAADALRRSGRTKPAAAAYLDSLRTWASLGETKDLPRAIAAERLLDTGRSMWWLGDTGRAVDLVMAAVDLGAETDTIPAGAVAFLIEAGRYRDALDACHRGLGEPAVNELYKVYMALWILAEARRIGEPPDRLAVEFLRNRRGELWHELLARAATGRLDFTALRAAATTGPRRGELAFYGAVLGLDPAAATPAGKAKLLQQVIDARVVLDAEYDLARQYLARP